MKRLLVAFVVTVAACKGKPAPVEIGAPVHPFGMLKDVGLGMTVDEVKQKAPRLEVAPDHRSAHAPYSDRDRYDVRFKDGRVSAIEIQLLKRSPEDLWKAWGAGTTFDPPPQEQRRYFDEARGALAEVASVGDSAHVAADSFAVRFGAYTPLAKLLDGPDAYSVAGVQILGRPIADVAADFKAKPFEVTVQSSADDTTVDVNLPSTEWSGIVGMDSLSLMINAGHDGKVHGWSLGNVASKAPASAKAAMLALYERKWGKPEERTGEYLYGKTPQVRVTKESFSPSISTLSPL